jgi:hypothetical protein
MPFGFLLLFLQAQHVLFLQDLFQKELILEFTSYLLFYLQELFIRFQLPGDGEEAG